MKLICSELKKIFTNRLIMNALALFLAINGVLCVYYLTQTRRGNHDIAVGSDASEYAEKYVTALDTVISEAAANLNQYDAQGIAIEDYVYQYQLKLIRTYSCLRDSVEFGTESAYGFDIFFDYKIADHLIFVLLILICSVIFTQEKSTGIMPILRSTRAGRKKTALAKLMSILIIISFIEILFALETSAIIGLLEGYSGLSAPLQSFGRYIYCPYEINVGGFILIRLLIRILAFMLFSVVIMLVSLFTYSYVIGCVSGLGLIGINLLSDALGKQTFSKVLSANIVNVVSVTPLFERYYAVDLSGYVVDLLPLVVFMYAALSAVLCVSIVLKYDSTSDSLTSRITARPHRKKIQDILFAAGKREYTGSLFISELYKLLISSRMIVIIVVLLTAKCTISYYVFQNTDSYGEAIYREYMTELAGELSDEKEKYLEDKREEMNGILSREPDMRRAYMADEITANEYRSYLDEYNTALIRSDYLAMIEDHARYIKRLAAEDKNAWFVYDTGWKALLFGSFDWTLYAAVLMLSGSFAMEYERRSSSGDFADIMRTTRFGRGRTFRAKYLSVLIVSFALIIAWNVVDAVAALRTYDLPLPSAPIYSIGLFSSFPIDITIAGYKILYYIVKLSAALSLAVIVCSLTCLMRRYLSALIVVIAATILPAVFSGFGLSIFDHVDYINYFRATPMMLNGLGGAVYMIAVAVISIILCKQAERRWKI